MGGLAERSRRRGITNVLMALAVGTVAVGGTVRPPTAASANTFPIYLCEDGYGTGAFASGWSSSAGNDLKSAANCSQPAGGSAAQENGDGLQAWSVEQANGSMAGAYWLHAPAGTAITGLTFAGTFDSFGGWVAHWATAGGGGGDPVEDCGETSNCFSNTPTDTAWSVDDASEIGFGLWCDASTCAANAKGDSIFGPAGTANVYNATVYINDPSAPVLGLSGTALTDDPGGWISDKTSPTGSAGQPSPLDLTRRASAT